MSFPRDEEGTWGCAFRSRLALLLSFLPAEWRCARSILQDLPSPWSVHPNVGFQRGRLWAPGSCSVGAKCTIHAPHWNTEKGRAAPGGGELRVEVGKFQRQGWTHKWGELRVTMVAIACGM